MRVEALEDEKKSFSISRMIKSPWFIAAILYTIHIILNFLGASYLKFFYLFEVIIFILYAIRFRWDDLFFMTFIFFTIEGQGRIIWHYHPLFRNIFDLYLIIIVTKNIVTTKSIFLPKEFPNIFKFLFVGHFLWYLIQFFNYQSVGPLGPLVATKIYIFPMLFFFMLVREKPRFDEDSLQLFSNKILFLIGAQAALVIFQMSQGEEFLFNITQYYERPLKGAFYGPAFRPFGTSHVAGGMALNMSYSIAFLFFGKKNSTIKTILITIVLIACIFSGVIMQVRSALLIMLFILFCCLFIKVYYSRVRTLIIPFILIVPIFFPLALSNLDIVQKAFPNLNLTHSIQRLKDIDSINKMSQKRASPAIMIGALKAKLKEAPFGLGPGRTGSANSLFINKIKNDPKYNMNWSWTFDNLFVALAIDLGYGMIFYTLIIILLPLYIFWNTILLAIKKVNILIPFVCSLNVLIILASNWGAIALPYNPVSFFFWVWLAFGVNQIEELKKVAYAKDHNFDYDLANSKTNHNSTVGTH